MKLIGANMDTKHTLGFALVTVIMAMLIGTASAAIADSNDPQSTNSNDGTIWIIGDFEQFGRRFDTHPHDDPTLIKYTIGDDLSKFPSGLGTDIGSQRSAIKIQFNEDLSEETILVIKWSPGGSIAFEQFRAEVDEKTVGHSQYLQGSSPPKWITEEFVIPTTSGNIHEVTLTHLKGDGLNLGAIGLFEKNAGPLFDILAGSGSSNDARYKNGLSIPMLFLILCGVLLIGYAVLKSKSRSSGEEKMIGLSVSTQPEHEEIMARDVESIIPTPDLEEEVTKRVDGNSEGVSNKAPQILDERIKRLWKTAWELGSSEVDREKAVSIYTELLDMVDEESTSHDICAIFRNRALAYWGLKNYDAAEKDLTKELDIAQRRGDSLRIMECRKVTDKVQTDKRKAEIKNEGGEKAEKFRAMEEIRLNLWSTGSKADSAFESLFEDLQNDDPDIRAEASRLLSINPNAIEKLVSIYQDCIDSEPRKGVLAGRVLGRNISISAGSQEMIHDETSSIMYGIAVAFTPCVCGHCGRVNLGIPVPEGGLYIGFYGQSDDKEGVYALPVLCDYCGKEFFIAWDDDPR